MAHFFDERVAKPIVRRLPRWIKANHLTGARTLLVAPVIYWRDDPRIAITALILSSLLDIFDGPVARIRGEASQFGAVLDATGDKVFILGALLFACGERVDPWTAWTIVSFDLALTVMRPIERWLKVSASSNMWGAAKTWAQSIALGMVLSRWEWARDWAPIVFNTAIGLAALSLAEHIGACLRRDPTAT